METQWQHLLVQIRQDQRIPEHLMSDGQNGSVLSNGQGKCVIEVSDYLNINLESIS